MSAAAKSSAESLWLAVMVGGQTFGLPVLRVRDVISSPHIDRIPLAPRAVAGSLNLRGRIVTAIDLRTRLGLPPRAEGAALMCAIVELGEGAGTEFYALLIDDVGDVLPLPDNSRESNPSTLNPAWRGLCDGLFRLEGGLMLALNIDETVMAIQ